jgi:6-phosphogluconolactonase (cycloisomerase 2 family)
MRRNPSPFALAAVSLLCILVLAACGNNTAILQYITISPTSATTSVGNSQQFTAQAYYSNGTIQPGTSLVTWGSSNQTVATITLGGVATALASGTTTITATAAGTSGASAILTVNQLVSIAVTPANSSVPAGGSVQFDAMGTFMNPGGTTGTMDISSLVTWASSTAIATINATGLASAGTTAGATMISASLYGVTGSTNLTVGAAVAVSLQIAPAAPTIAIGNSASFTAQELWSDGSLHTPAGAVTWSSDTLTTASILASSGIASAVGAGTANITATEGTLTGTTVLTVVTGSAHFAYISNTNDDTIQWYAVNTATSPYLTGGGNTGAAGYAPVQTVLHPSGLYLYAISTSAGLYLYDVAPPSSSTPAPGTLTLTSPSALTIGAMNDNYWGVVDPYGRFLYVSDDGLSGGPSTIFGFKISQTDGTLTPIQGAAPFTDTNLSGPESLVIDQSGTYLYAVNSVTSTISIYTIDQTATATSGALTPLAGQPTVPTGPTPESAALHPSGAFVYVANQGTGSAGTGSVSAYSIDTTSTDPTAGQLTALSNSPFAIASATDVFNVLVDPSGKFLYALDAGPFPGNGQVYSYNLSSGVIGTAVGSPAATGSIPFSFAIDPTGVLLASANSFDMPGTISLFSVSSGALGTGITVPSDTSSSQSSSGSDPLFIVFYNAP